jgi:hypothetical protein
MGRSGIVGYTAVDAVGLDTAGLIVAFSAAIAFFAMSELLRRCTVRAFDRGPKPWRYLALFGGQLLASCQALDQHGHRSVAEHGNCARLGQREGRRPVVDHRRSGRFG